MQLGWLGEGIAVCVCVCACMCMCVCVCQFGMQQPMSIVCYALSRPGRHMEVWYESLLASPRACRAMFGFLHPSLSTLTCVDEERIDSQRKAIKRQHNQTCGRWDVEWAVVILTELLCGVFLYICHCTSVLYLTGALIIVCLCQQWNQSG